MGVLFSRDTKVPKSTALRATTLAVHTLTACVTAGVIIGFGQLYPLLVDSEVYAGLCPVNSTSGNATAPSSNSTASSSGGVCPQQEVAITNMFNYGAIVSTFVQGPAGFALDVVGPKLTALIGFCMLVPGAFLFAFSSIHFDGYLAGFVLMSAGGPWTFLSVMPSASLFPKNQAMVLMFLNGAYGGGAFVFFVFGGLYNNAGVSLKALFLGYGVLCGALAVLVLLVWPMRKYGDVMHAGGNAETSVVGEEMPLLAGEVRQVPWGQRARDILRDVLTVDYIWHTLFTSFMIFCVNFYLSTSYQQLEVMSSDMNLVNSYSFAFGVLLPAIGFIGGTPLGHVMDKFGVYVGALVLIFLHCVASALALIPVLPLQMVRYVIFSSYNPVVFGYWATFIVIKFGTFNYGFLYGFIAFVAGAVNFAATPIDAYTATAGSYFWVYVAFLAGVTPFVWHPIFRLIKDRRQSAEDRKSLINN